MVRVWCVPVQVLDRQHLLGEHVELHVIFNAITKLKQGFHAGWQKHPQTLRFIEHLGMLVDRHDQQVEEMRRRGYRHKSPLDVPENLDYEHYVYSASELLGDLAVLESRGGLLEANKT